MRAACMVFGIRGRLMALFFYMEEKFVLQAPSSPEPMHL